LFKRELGNKIMKRRDFIKVSSAAGIIGLVGPRYGALANSASSGVDGFDLHPFIKEHPKAVFINITSVKEKSDSKGIYEAASRLANEMFVKTTNGAGYPNSTKITCKPNWTCSGHNARDPLSQLGINTDLNFIEGYMNAVKTKGPKDLYLRECACPFMWEANGWTQMAKRNNFDLRDLSSKDFWEMEKDELVFKKVDGGVVHRAPSLSIWLNSKLTKWGLPLLLKTFRELPLRNFTSSAEAILIFLNHMTNVTITFSSLITCPELRNFIKNM
jgi:hypothetical protein